MRSIYLLILTINLDNYLKLKGLLLNLKLIIKFIIIYLKINYI